MWHGNGIYCKCTSGKARNLWDAAKGKQYLQKKTVQSYTENYSAVLTYATIGVITHTHTHTHTHTKKFGNTWVNERHQVY